MKIYLLFCFLFMSCSSKFDAGKCITGPAPLTYFDDQVIYKIISISKEGKCVTKQETNAIYKGEIDYVFYKGKIETWSGSCDKMYFDPKSNKDMAISVECPK